jgi:hypothetical protein
MGALDRILIEGSYKKQWRYLKMRHNTFINDFVQRKTRLRPRKLGDLVRVFNRNNP